MKYISLSVALILLLSLSAGARSNDYPVISNVESDPPLCYMERTDGIALDLSQLCGKSSPNNNSIVRSANGRAYVPLRSTRQAEKCNCPYDTDSTGKACGSRSIFAEGSPVCYKPAT